MDMQVVYEKSDYEGFSCERVGLRIEDRVFWFAYTDSLTMVAGRKEYAKWELIAKEIVSKCGRGKG